MTTTPPLACPPRWGTPRRPERLTYGTKATEVAALLGIKLMPWQQHVLDVALEVNPATGRLAYRQVFLSLPRQSGKTAVLLVLWITRCLAMGQRQQVIYTAQDRNSARKKWEKDFLGFLEDSKLRPGKHFTIRRSNGSEGTFWRTTRSWQGISATLATSGHGEALDLVLIDEAFAFTDPEAIDGSFGPPMLTRPEPQMWVVSTAGTWKSTFLNQRREAARAAAEADTGTGTACFEWSADPEWDLSDRSRWPLYMPGLVDGLVTKEAVAAAIAPMSELAARRAFMNLTTEPDEEEQVEGMDIEAWARQELQEEDDGEMDGPLVAAIAVSMDRTVSSVGMAGYRPDGDIQVEVADRKPGTGWLVDRVVGIVARHGAKGVAVDPGSPAGPLIQDFQDEGIEVFELGARAYAQACGRMYDRVDHGRIWHRGQTVLNDAVVGAKRRPLGDAWAWDRRASGDDITPLEAVSLAAGALVELPEDEDDGEYSDAYGPDGFEDW